MMTNRRLLITKNFHLNTNSQGIDRYCHDAAGCCINQARSQGGGGGGGSKGVCSPPVKVGAPQKTQKMKPPCYCWQYRPQTQPIIDQATDLTVCKIGSLIVTVGLYIL